MPKPAAKPLPSLYDTDFHAWSQQQGLLLKARNPAALDWDNLAEEIESLGRSDRREIASRLAVIIEHLLKWEYQPAARSQSWAASLHEQRHRLEGLLEESPSLRPYPASVLKKEYAIGRRKAAGESGIPIAHFPRDCPYSIPEILDPAFFPGS